MNYAMMIKEYRDRALLSQQDLAAILNVSIVSVNRWENVITNQRLKQKEN